VELLDDETWREEVQAVEVTLDELNQKVEGYSHYFLKEPLRVTVASEQAFSMESEALRHLLDITLGVLSMVPRHEMEEDGPLGKQVCPNSPMCDSLPFLSRSIDRLHNTKLQLTLEGSLYYRLIHLMVPIHMLGD
jgi:hypothetical protein